MIDRNGKGVTERGRRREKMKENKRGVDSEGEVGKKGREKQGEMTIKKMEENKAGLSLVCHGRNHPIRQACVCGCVPHRHRGGFCGGPLGTAGA